MGELWSTVVVCGENSNSAWVNYEGDLLSVGGIGKGWTRVEQGSQWPEEGWGQVDAVSLEQLSSYWALHLVF